MARRRTFRKGPSRGAVVADLRGATTLPTTSTAGSGAVTIETVPGTTAAETPALTDAAVAPEASPAKTAARKSTTRKPRARRKS